MAISVRKVSEIITVVQLPLSSSAMIRFLFCADTSESLKDNAPATNAPATNAPTTTSAGIRKTNLEKKIGNQRSLLT